MTEPSSPHQRTPSGLPRARALRIPFDGRPGRFNSITDVAGLEVGYSTIIRGDGQLEVGKGPVRTGVTAILPRGRDGATTPVFAGYHTLNGSGELTGTIWIEEAGLCEGPITITNTNSCGTARDASAKWMVRQPGFRRPWILPVAGETYDGWLNDINGFHVRDEHVFEAIDSARGGQIEEGSVGGGTGMICYGFKGGSGASSRVVDFDEREYVVGAFVQANFGDREQLTIAGVPVGRNLAPMKSEDEDRADDSGSVIAVVATDAPLLPHQLKRLARRVSLGVGRSGATSGDSSGDIFLAISTANAEVAGSDQKLTSVEFAPNGNLNGIFEAVVDAVDEAIINALIANETMVGVNGRTVEALPHQQVRTLLSRYHRI